MHVIRGETGRELQLNVVDAIFAEGEKVAPRGQPTLELSPATLVLEDPRDAIPTGVNRDRLSLAVGAAEALQLIGGVSVPELLARIAPHFENFMNEERRFDGAYGPRVRQQLLSRQALLARDPDTRQAVATIFDARDTVRPVSRDYPCTLSLHFLVRRGKLNLHTTMRSNDAWLGLPYDLFQFTQLQCSMARSLGYEPGRYFHTANSLHLYERNFDAARALAPEEDFDIHTLDGIGLVHDEWSDVQEVAELLLDGGGERPHFTTTERWYSNVLAPYVSMEDMHIYEPEVVK